jgi:hypothetical protein
MRKRQITVTVVDDDPSILSSVRELLNAKGLITEPFASAEGFRRSTCSVLFLPYAGLRESFCRDFFAALRLPRLSGLLGFVLWPVGNDRTDELV